MTKKDLIKNILELGKELEKANGFDAIMIINDMEIEIDNYTKQLPIPDVVERSGQLEALRKDFCLWYYAQTQPLDAHKVVDWFASNLR